MEDKAPFGVAPASVSTLAKVPYSAKIGTLIPDLIYVNTTTNDKELFEIKPDNVKQIIAGYAQLAAYVITLNKLDPSGGWTVGKSSTYKPPLTLETTNPFGFVVITQLPGGLIVYDSLQQYVKKEAESTVGEEEAENDEGDAISDLTSLLGF